MEDRNNDLEDNSFEITQRRTKEKIQKKFKGLKKTEKPISK